MMLNFRLVSCLLIFCISQSGVRGQEITPMPEATDRPQLQFDLYWISVQLKEGDSIPKPVADLIREVDPSQVQALGGVPVGDLPNDSQTYSAMPAANSVAAARDSSGVDASDSHLVVKINQAQFNSIVEKTKQDASSVISQAPSILVYAGDSAQISAGSQKPFVTSLEEVKGDFALAYQPGVSMFLEGMTVSINTSELTGKKFDLELSSRISQIKRVTNINLRENAQGESPVIQFPETASKSANLALPFEVDQIVMVLLGTREEEVREEKGLPIPGLEKMFRNSTVGKVRKQDLLLVRVKRAN
jgi:hypothetical protein